VPPKLALSRNGLLLCAAELRQTLSAPGIARWIASSGDPAVDIALNKRRHMASLLKIDLAKIHAPQVFVLTKFSNHIIYLHAYHTGCNKRKTR
jgi:hypothetical protein